MLLGGGAVDGVRIRGPSTVRLMATDQLDPAVTERSWLPGKGAVGFGLDFAVRKAPPQSAAENRGAVGEFFWDGAATTLFWVDPANRLTAIFFVQTMPFDRSEEHTSELQSLMRISYAVFCLKKKKTQPIKSTQTT